MQHNNLDILLKTDDGSTVSLGKTKKYSNTKRKINGICEALSKEKGEYDPTRTVESITRYIEYKDKIDRILYSEISSYIFSLDMNARGVFATNIENLMLYALNLEEKDIDDDCRKIIIKIYDHSQLALNQIENVRNILGAGIEEARLDLKKEIKGIEKEYISILGIFASIVLAFVGGITFSSSVLQNIGKVSIYRLLMVIILLALVLVNVIWMLIRFIAQINDKDIQMFSIRVFNRICLLIFIVIIGAWMLNMQEIPEFISKVLPWCE